MTRKSVGRFFCDRIFYPDPTDSVGELPVVGHRAAFRAGVPTFWLADYTAMWTAIDKPLRHYGGYQRERFELVYLTDEFL